MKTSLAILFAILALACGQRRNNGADPRNVAILQDSRYLSGDGSFGSAYVQDDGSEFKEETDADGTRKGQYSYVDPDGKKITVHYTAGKNGFQVTGDHLPKAPQPVPAAAPAPTPTRQQKRPQQQYYQQPAPVPQYESQPQYNSIQNQPQRAPQQFAYSFGANDNNNNGQYQQQDQYNQNYYQPQQQFNNNYNIPTTTTTQAPSRYFPPGKLNLNRTPTGYQYQFTSQ